MLKANFTITESGGTGVVQLQSSADSGATWQNVGQTLTLTNGQRTVTDDDNISIDDTVYLPGTTYSFRLIDTAGSPVSDVLVYAIPIDESISIALSGDAGGTHFKVTATVINGSGNYRILGLNTNPMIDGWAAVGSPLTNQPLNGTFDMPEITVDGSIFVQGNNYQFKLHDDTTSVESDPQTYHIPLPSITGYAAVHTEIGFANPSGGDNWVVSFAAAPSASQSSDKGASLTGYDYTVDFYAGGNKTALSTATSQTGDVNYNGSNGAGVYILTQKHNYSNGFQTQVARVVKVDGAGNILGDMQLNGNTVNSTTGLNIDVTHEFVQSGVSESVTAASIDVTHTDFTVLGTGLSYSGPLKTDTVAVYYWPSLDATFWNDLSSEVFSTPPQYISSGFYLSIS